MNIYYHLLKNLIKINIKYSFRAVLGGSNWYEKWIIKNENYDVNIIRDECNKFHFKPLISVVIPTYNTEKEHLIECLDSVLKQYYTNWEICIADDYSTVTHVRDVINEYKSKGINLKVVYNDTNRHISAASNKALSLATGEFVAFLDHDDILAPFAFYEVVRALNIDSTIDMLFSNEDKLLGQKRVQPFFKKNWGVNLLLRVNYICHISVYRTTIVRHLQGFREGYEGVQDLDLALRVMQTNPKIKHLPYFLYHWRISPNSTAGSGKAKKYIKERHQKLLINYKLHKRLR